MTRTAQRPTTAAIATTDDELAGLAAQLATPPHGGTEDWVEARDAFTSMHDTYTATVAAGAHPAAIHYCAALLESRASDLEAATPDTAKELKALCSNVLELAETVAFAAEHPLWAHEDTELRHPPPTPQRPGASFAEAAAWDMAPQDELDAIAELVAQDTAAAQQGLAWRSDRDRFLKYHAGFRIAGLNPAIAHYYTKEMIRCITDMLRHTITPEPARALHHRAQKLLWEIEDDAEYEMYCHDAASFEYAYPPTAARPQPATADD